MIATQCVIREANPLDRSQILHINRKTWEMCYSHIYSQREITGLFHNILKQYGSWVYRRDQRLSTWVAGVDGQVAGFIGTASILNTTSAEITSFYLLPDYHGQGIGKQLWQTALYDLKQQGFDSIWVWVLEKAEARQFYEAQGCIPRKQGTYSVGIHCEKAIGYWLSL